MTRIVEDRPATVAEWEEACRGCGHATYFHTPAWAGLFAAPAGRAEIATRRIAFDDGAAAVIPLLKIRRLSGLLTTHQSSPAGTYGGWVSESRLSQDHAHILARRMLRLPGLVWRENPYDPHLPRIEIPGAVDEHSQIIDLHLGLDAIYEQTTHAHKKALRKAEREGVRVRPAESMEDWRAYFDLYLASLDRWKRGGPEKRTRGRYEWGLFRNVAERRSPHERLWLAVHRDEIIAGILCFYWGEHMVTWHAAALAERFDVRPNNALYWEILRDAAGRGFRWFDFNPSGGYSGVVSFKDNFGGERRRARVLDRRPWLLRLAARLRGGR